MDTFLAVFNLFTLTSIVYAVTPDICFANFRWDDCGGRPKPVMYYWKPGSRCEVGIWRGCLPNPNMFIDEYECIRTCIFATRGGVMDALDVLKVEEDNEIVTETTTVESENITVSVENSTSANDTAGNVTVSGGANDTATSAAAAPTTAAAPPA